jgi:hypothetical protein
MPPRCGCRNRGPLLAFTAARKEKRAMARGKGSSKPSDDPQRIENAKDIRPEENKEASENRPDENREEWWRNEGGGEGEVY